MAANANCITNIVFFYRLPFTAYDLRIPNAGSRQTKTAKEPGFLGIAIAIYNNLPIDKIMGRKRGLRFHAISYNRRVNFAAFKKLEDFIFTKIGNIRTGQGAGAGNIDYVFSGNLNKQTGPSDGIFLRPIDKYFDWRISLFILYSYAKKRS